MIVQVWLPTSFYVMRAILVGEMRSSCPQHHHHHQQESDTRVNPAPAPAPHGSPRRSRRARGARGARNTGTAHHILLVLSLVVVTRYSLARAAFVWWGFREGTGGGDAPFTYSGSQETPSQNARSWRLGRPRRRPVLRVQLHPLLLPGNDDAKGSRLLSAGLQPPNEVRAPLRCSIFFFSLTSLHEQLRYHFQIPKWRKCHFTS